MKEKLWNKEKLEDLSEVMSEASIVTVPVLPTRSNCEPEAIVILFEVVEGPSISPTITLLIRYLDYLNFKLVVILAHQKKN